MTTAVLGFHPRLYEVPGEGKPFGATVASTAFLRAFLAGGGALPVRLDGEATAADARRLLDAIGLAAPVEVADDAALARIGALHLPHPGLAPVAWERHRTRGAAYSITGIAHAIASPAAFQALADLVTAPLAPWDAVICPSAALRAAIGEVIAAERDYLAWRLGADVAPALPALPVIPLGVDLDRFAPRPDLRERWRAAIGVGPDDVVLLYVGRLSAGRKANPLPLFLAAEGAARRHPGRLVIAMAGWFADEASSRAFAAGAAKLCPSVPVKFLDGRAPAVREGVWSAGDVFVSLVDNLQETFGLSPVEAMAAGLPVIASDWDGYRETVRDGVDGLLVPTAMPAPGFGAALADRLASPDGALDFLTAASQTVAVSIDAAAAAIERLAGDRELRRRMGEAGRARARDYAWPSVIARYRALWAELGERRRAAAQPDGPPRSVRVDPYRAFAGYPSRAIAPATVVSLAAGAVAELVGRRHRHGQLRLDSTLFPSVAEYAALFDRIAAGPTEVAAAAAILGAEREAVAVRGIAVLAKLGLVVLDPPDQRGSR